ncbi:MAG: bifunctional UDP-N-acetylglucosamine diphosphorylase/glucosamine-1-phosphate N-acetyltransferase GlmU [Alphaproteobacteria bacterium]
MSARPDIVILAAGAGTRMKSACPKVLHQVAGRPMIAHVVAEAKAIAGRMMVVIAPGQDAVRAAAAPAETCVQKVARGTGDAVRIALTALGAGDAPVLVAYGDMPCVTAAVLRRVLGALPRQGNGLAVLGFHVDRDNAYGRLVMDAEGGLARIVEARDATAAERQITLCNSGLLAASSGRLLARLLARLTTANAKGEYYLTDVVGLARADDVPCFAVEGPGEELLGVNSRAELAAAEATMQTRLRARVMDGGATLIDPATVYLSFDTRLGRDTVVGPNVWFGPGVRIGDNVEIRSSCHIEGARVGDDCIIGPFARLRPGADLGRGVHIGNFVEIKAAKVEAGAKINHLTYIGDARVGADANIGAGTITCNYDGVDKHVTRIGARSFIGSDVALVAPVTVGDGAVVGAGSVITKNVPKGALAIARGAQSNVAGGGTRYLARKTAAKQAKGKSPARGKKKVAARKMKARKAKSAPA